MQTNNTPELNGQDRPINNSERYDIIKLLEKQNELLGEIIEYLDLSTDEDGNGEQLKVRINMIPPDISIGSLAKFMLKWLVASIPVAIIVVIVYYILSIVFPFNV